MKSAVTGLALLPLAWPVLSDNFLNSCEADSVVIEGATLTARCKPVRGDPICSNLDLGKCLKNSYGSIQDDPHGEGPSIGAECINCSNSRTSAGMLAGVPTLLHCQCDSHIGQPSSRWPTAMIDIITVVDNANGYLACHGHKGVLCEENQEAQQQQETQEQIPDQQEEQQPQQQQQEQEQDPGFTIPIVWPWEDDGAQFVGSKSGKTP